MTLFMPQHTDIFLFALPGFVLLTIAETIFLVKEHRFDKHLKDIPVSFTIGAGFILINFFSKAVLLLLYQWVYAHRIYTLPVNGLYMWMLCFIAEDFSYYWFHRLSHQIRVLWASHSVHHTAEIYSLSSAGFRQTWTGNFSGTFVFWLWMPLCGLRPWYGTYSQSHDNYLPVLAFIQKQSRKLPAWIEVVFNTPSHHRVHHGSDLVYLDKNYGGY